jgi:hypothetical protein
MTCLWFCLLPTKLKSKILHILYFRLINDIIKLTLSIIKTLSLTGFLFDLKDLNFLIGYKIRIKKLNIFNINFEFCLILIFHKFDMKFIKTEWYLLRRLIFFIFDLFFYFDDKFLNDKIFNEAFKLFIFC